MDNESFVEEIKSKVLENAHSLRRDNLQSSINCSLRFAQEHSRDEANLEGKKGIGTLIYEMNEFYMEMAEKLTELRADFGHRNDDVIEDDAQSIFSEEMVTSLERYGDALKIRKQVEIIKRLEEDVARSFERLESEQCERKLVESELCELLEGDDSKDAQIFLGMCQRTRRAEARGDNAAAQPEATKRKCIEATFIRRNIELAKNSRAMDSTSLTDEEKIKLQSLLTNLDESQAFTMEEVDGIRLQELESQLNTFNESAINFDEIDRNEREGKYWKTDQRLKEIDQELKLIHEAREKGPSEDVRVSVDVENLVDVDIIKEAKIKEVADIQGDDNNEQ